MRFFCGKIYMNGVVLYYPNKWREHSKNFVKNEDLDFTWFLCGKRYKDLNTGLDVVELSHKSKFYDENTGDTFILNPNIKKVIVTLNTDINPEDYGYQGYVSSKGCQKSCAYHFLCKDVKFYFLKDVLVLPIKQEECEIIRYSKRNYKTIKKVVKEFPYPKEIDEALEKYNKNLISKVLYQYISEYFSKVK